MYNRIMTLTQNKFKILFFHIKWAAGSRNLFNSLHAKSMVSFDVRASFYFKFLVSFMMHIFNTFHLFPLICFVFFVFYVVLFRFCLFFTSHCLVPFFRQVLCLGSLPFSRCQPFNSQKRLTWNFSLSLISLHHPANRSWEFWNLSSRFFYPHLTPNSQN